MFAKAFEPINASELPEIVSVLSFDQSANAPAPICVTVLGTVSRSIVALPAKTLLPTAAMPAPNVILAMAGLFLNAPLPSVVSWSGNTSDVSAQLAKAEAPRLFTPVPSVAEASAEHPSNALAPISVTEFGMVMAASFTHPAKHPVGMEVILLSDAEVRETQLLKARSPSVSAETDACARPLPAKASVPIVFTLFKAISVNAVQPLNAFAPTAVTLEGMFTAARAVQPSNVSAPISATPVGITVSVNADNL